MEAEAALELVKKGAALLALDVPLHTVFGIDTQAQNFSLSLDLSLLSRFHFHFYFLCRCFRLVPILRVSR